MKAEKVQEQKSRTSGGVFTCRQTSMRSPFSFVLFILHHSAFILSRSFFVFLFIVRAVQAAGGNWIAILLALQSAVAAFLLVMHKPVERMSHPVMTLLSWLCALLPLTFNLEEADALYSLPGLLLALWALFALGFSFSIVPEDRGVVMRGPYRLVRHPMYLGEILSLLGLCLSSGSLWNWLALLLFVRLLLLRISAEERTLADYPRYKTVVRWRLIPFVW